MKILYDVLPCLDYTRLGLLGDTIVQDLAGCHLHMRPASILQPRPTTFQARALPAIRLGDAVSVWNRSCLTVGDLTSRNRHGIITAVPCQSGMGRLALECSRPVSKAMYVASMTGQPASRARRPDQTRSDQIRPDQRHYSCLSLGRYSRYAGLDEPETPPKSPRGGKPEDPQRTAQSYGARSCHPRTADPHSGRPGNDSRHATCHRNGAIPDRRRDTAQDTGTLQGGHP